MSTFWAFAKKLARILSLQIINEGREKCGEQLTEEFRSNPAAACMMGDQVKRVIMDYG